MRILIVEDEINIADGLQTVLRKEGYDTDAVYDGLSGLDYIMSGIYDLILLDIMLPKMNGLEVLKKAREEGIAAPILLLTAKSQIDDVIKGLDVGADDYITKPFDSGELLARIRARVRVGRTSVDNKISVGDIWIDGLTMKLGGKEKTVKLGNKEYQLIEYLMLNKGQILARDMLISKVWGPDEESDYNSLEVYISFLRKKMKFVNSSTKIVTTKGVGYSIEEDTDG